MRNTLRFIMITTAIACLWSSKASFAETMKTKSLINWVEVTDDEIQTVKFKQIDKVALIKHQHEERGFINVPLDYKKEKGMKIDIFYRLIPSSRTFTTEGKKLPILVIMNGGPGSPSSSYRELSYDYSAGTVQDKLFYLAKHFRILLVDQRGTGFSTPIDLDDPKISPNVIAKYFDADEHARDHLAVINHVVPENERFFIIAQSYGGHIGFNYLSMKENTKMPTGIIFSSALQPHINPLDLFVKRREKQKELNMELKLKSPGTIRKIELLKAKLESFELPRGTVNYLWDYLGKYEDWIVKLDERVTHLLDVDSKKEMESEFQSSMIQTVNLLNYILSSSALTPNYTDNTIVEKLELAVEFDSWMLDESWTLKQVGAKQKWLSVLLDNIDLAPPPPSYFPPIEELKTKLSKTNALFTFGKTDSFFDYLFLYRSAKRFHLDNKTEYKVFNGGHSAAFTAEAAQYISLWSKLIDN